MNRKLVGMEGSTAVAEAVKLARAEVVPAYPITPQSHIAEALAEAVANGELDAEYIPVESEHSAMSACLGSSATGARTFTATAGQGLELMHEVLYVASGMRLPIVMAVANRALSAPLNIWGDHSDVMAARDCGWIQLFSENVQEAFDLTICAFRIAEHPDVLFPVMVTLDGFNLSHVVEPMSLLEQEQVDRFLPPYQHPYALDPSRPVTMGAFASPSLYTEAKKAQDMDLRASAKVIADVLVEFEKLSGRRYLPVETYRTEEAKVLLLTMGSLSETAMEAVDHLRSDGEKVGLVHLRQWRPFPFEELVGVVHGAELLIVLDRALSTGGPGGPVCSEVKAAFYDMPDRPKIVGFVGGLGGREIGVRHFEALVQGGKELAEKGVDVGEVEMFGVRE
jgi:pyruvate ferredoxin oxidoreductase alpha subunit